jgi:hypothetical protein
MQKRIAMIALGVLTIPALGGIAYAASHSVSDSPAPKVVIPASPRAATVRSDEPAGHDAGDNSGRGRGAGDHATTSTTATPPTTAVRIAPRRNDDPATHDVGDDHGGTTATPTVSDDGPGHDVGDDHGDQSSNSGSGSGGSGRHGG